MGEGGDSRGGPPEWLSELIAGVDRTFATKIAFG